MRKIFVVIIAFALIGIWSCNSCNNKATNEQNTDTTSQKKGVLGKDSVIPEDTIGTVIATYDSTKYEIIDTVKNAVVLAQDNKEAKKVKEKHKVTVKIPKVVKSQEQKKTYVVTKIGKRAYANNDKIRNLTIPNTVTTIEDHAFTECLGLRTVRIPKSVKKIGRGAFEGCWKLEKVYIPKNTKVHPSAFDLCETVKIIRY